MPRPKYRSQAHQFRTHSIHRLSNLSCLLLPAHRRVRFRGRGRLVVWAPARWCSCDNIISSTHRARSVGRESASGRRHGTGAACEAGHGVTDGGGREEGRRLPGASYPCPPSRCSSFDLGLWPGRILLSSRGVIVLAPPTLLPNFPRSPAPGSPAPIYYFLGAVSLSGLLPSLLALHPAPCAVRSPCLSPPTTPIRRSPLSSNAPHTH
jgi:hypothetical protein